MQKGIKLAIGGLGLAGANVLIIPFLNNNFEISNYMKVLDWGGHSLEDYGSKYLEGKSNKLDFKGEVGGDKNNQLELSNNSANLPQLNLELSESGDSLLLDSLTKEKENVQNVLKNVISEIKTEDQVTALKSQIKDKYEKTIKQYLNGQEVARDQHLNNFQKIKEKVERWSSQKQNKGATTSTSREERESLQKIYEAYSKLSDEKVKLSDNLNSITTLESEQLNQLKKMSAPSLNEIKSSLRTIKWTQDKVQLTKQGGGGKKMFRNDWGEWTKNPYRHFYKDENSYKKDISYLNSAIATIEKGKQQLARDRGMWGWKNAVHSFNQIEKQLNEMASNAGSHIELQVAKKLLENMNLSRVI